MKKLLLLLLAGPLLAKDLFLNTDKIEPDLSSIKNEKIYRAYCGLDEYDPLAEAKITRIVTNRPALDKIVNGELATEKDVVADLADQINAFTADMDEEKAKAARAEKTAKGASADRRGDCNMSVLWTAGYFGHYKNLEMFTVDFYSYEGGVHGIFGKSYLVIDDRDRQLKLEDILVPGQRDELGRLLGQRFLQFNKVDSLKEYQEKDLCCLALKNEEQPDAPVDLNTLMRQQLLENENFFFNTDGLAFSYPPYFIAPYSEGNVVLTVPYDELVGVLKDEYLPH